MASNTIKAAGDFDTSQGEEREYRNIKQNGRSGAERSEVKWRSQSRNARKSKELSS